MEGRYAVERYGRDEGGVEGEETEPERLQNGVVGYEDGRQCCRKEQ